MPRGSVAVGQWQYGYPAMSDWLSARQVVVPDAIPQEPSTLGLQSSSVCPPPPHASAVRHADVTRLPASTAQQICVASGQSVRSSQCSSSSPLGQLLGSEL